MMIANATGCSSIYGASIPSIPYSIPWASSLFEDNAEFGYGIKMSDIVKKEEIKNIMMNIDEDFAHTWLDNMNNYEITKQVYDSIDYNKYPKLNELKDFIVKRSNWIIGGDGWAYDIGFSGIDHVLASNQDINILILNTEVYSNTGGQTSKATNEGAVAPFASTGKKTVSKDLAKIAMTYSNTYVAQINLGANMMQTIKALKEAEKHDGPSIIIAYAPCINHGIDGGMVNSLHVASLATKSGYYPIFRYDSNKFILDSKNVDFDTYKDFLMTQNRFKQLSKVNPNDADKLIEEAKEKAIKNYKYYENLEKETSIN
jgi:pyruvate-ferredoxin/flavodoxin oxidoreductase